MNAYFASVEQHDDPRLRGRPVAVAPVMAETSSCIAASYEAKKFGVKTGTRLSEARLLCPGIQIREARPGRYIEVHHEILRAIEPVIHVDRVMSIDEMLCRLLGPEREPNHACSVAAAVKYSLRSRLGQALTCSIGLGPNVMLAKVAADMQKPDGLTVIDEHELPRRLEGLQLDDFPGIGPRMTRRLHARGVLTVRQFCQLSERELCQLWGSKVLGSRWFHSLRGIDMAAIPTKKGSVGHSHVLPPELRNEDDAWAVLQRMLYKAAMRLRHENLKARSISVHVDYLGREGWGARRRIDPTADTPTLRQVTEALYRRKPAGKILKVGVVLGDVIRADQIPDHLFARDRGLLALSKVMDQVNQRFGIKAAYFGALHDVLHRAPMRIAFNRIPNAALERLSEAPPPPTPGMWNAPPGGLGS